MCILFFYFIKTHTADGKGWIAFLEKNISVEENLCTNGDW